MEDKVLSYNRIIVVQSLRLSTISSEQRDEMITAIESMQSAEGLENLMDMWKKFGTEDIQNFLIKFNEEGDSD